MWVDEVYGEAPGLNTGLFVDEFETFLNAPVGKVEVFVQMPRTARESIAVHAVRIGCAVPGGTIFFYVFLIVIFHA